MGKRRKRPFGGMSVGASTLPSMNMDDLAWQASNVGGLSPRRESPRDITRHRDARVVTGFPPEPGERGDGRVEWRGVSGRS
jgi:hypothetical protein